MWLRGLYRGSRARRRLDRSRLADGAKQAPEQASETADIAS
jgi:hypothetical protein